MFRILLLFASLSVLSACNKPPEPPEPLRPVKTLRVSVEDQSRALSLPGEVRARHEAALAFQVGGKITRCAVNSGDTVRRGQILAQLEPVDYALSEQSAAASEAQARSNLSVAENEFKRFQALFEKNFVSAAALEQKQAALDAARANHTAARASHTEQSRRVAYTALTADGDGVITQYNCNIGQVVSAGQSIMGLARKGEMEILVHVPESALNTVNHSPTFLLRLNALPGVSWQGRLRELSAAADPATRTYAARIRVDKPDARLRLGMTATVEIASSAQSAIYLPLSAIISRDGKPGVWQLNAENTVQRVEITLGELAGNTVQVLSGIRSGDEIIVAGADLLREGEKVKRLP